METLWLGCGCFWSAEDAYRAVEGVVDTEVGFVLEDGFAPCEVVRVTFDPDRVPLRELLDRFFRLHDPTEDLSLDEPGARSLVGVADPAHASVASESLEAALASGPFDGEARTTILVAPRYTVADDHHQDYLARQRGDVPSDNAPG